MVATGAAVTGGAASYAYRRRRRAGWTAPAGRVVQTSSLSVRVLGDHGPPVLLLHGLVAAGFYWGGAYDRLAAGHRLVVPDLLGFGRSPRPASGYGPDGHADAVRTCLADLGIDEPVVIGAHSLGTLIALRLAATSPERVRGIAAFGPPLYPDRRSARAHVGATSPMSRLFVLPGRSAERVCRWVCGHRAVAARLASVIRPELPPEIAADAVQHTWTSYSSTLQEVILDAGAAAWLPQVRCPLHLVAGTRDPVVDHHFVRRVARTHDTVELDERPGHHDLPLSRPEDCRARIAALLGPG